MEAIDQLFPDAKSLRRAEARTGPEVAAVTAFAKQIPPELLTLTGQDLSDYIVALEYIESVSKSALANRQPYAVQEYRGLSVIVLLRDALSKCPDEAPTPATTELSFISDDDLRESIRRDISAANQNVVNGGWKGATVLAGSATEALLLWAVQKEEEKAAGTIANAVSTLQAVGTLLRKPDTNPERWTFVELIVVALCVGLIKPDTAVQARLGKDFRNLIHPGRAARLGQICDRATALSALAAVEHVVRNLTP